ncbi:MAG: tail fiber domain-containing protein [Verrucomicrobia bacterium]|nr:tail fiber domain-containing protein [Verrucomicrobiota bacterium]
MAINPTSDRNAKEHFAAVDGRSVLEKVAMLPIESWNFKKNPGIRHIGPMAQDFHAAFAVGSDDRHIATVDADGVALAAIQGLNQIVNEQQAALRQKDGELQSLQRRLEVLERAVLGSPTALNRGGK